MTFFFFDRVFCSSQEAVLMNLCAFWCESSSDLYVALRLIITCWFHLLSAEREANLRICKFPEHDFVPVGTLTLIQAATVCQGLRPYYCATSKKGFRPVAEIWSGLLACTIVHVCLRVWVPSCTKWKYMLWKPSNENIQGNSKKLSFTKLSIWRSCCQLRRNTYDIRG